MAWRDLLQHSCAVCLLVWMCIVMPPLAAATGADFQILGGPGRINSERYDIEAQAAGNPPRQQITGPMLQALLKDRFQLQLHHDRKDLPVFTLVAAKGGVRLKPSKLEGSCAILYQKEACADIRRGPFSIDVKAVRMEDLIEVLSFTVGRVVIDQTGFHGLFDAHLESTPDETALAGLSGPPGHDAMSGGGSRGECAEDVAPYRPSISRALEEQLGLRLESKRAPRRSLSGGPRGQAERQLALTGSAA